MYGVLGGSLEVSKFLVVSGADPTITDIVRFYLHIYVRETQLTYYRS